MFFVAKMAQVAEKKLLASVPPHVDMIVETVLLSNVCMSSSFDKPLGTEVLQ